MAAIGNWQAAIENIWKVHCNSITDNFKDLRNEIDKIQFVNKMKYIRDVPWLEFYLQSCQKLHLKSVEKSIQHRNHGNKLFQVKKYAEALALYTQSIMEAPDNTQNLGLAYGNHSAANFYLQNYKECEEGIKLALENQYPQSTSYKLYLRWAQCLYRTGDVDQATHKLKISKNAVLKNESIEEKRKVQLLDEMKLLETEIAKNRNQEKVGISGTCTDVPEVYQGRNTVLTQASSAVAMVYNVNKGRHIQATTKIPAGSTVIVEKPYASVLLPGHYLTHCHHCIGRLTTVIPCKRCTLVLYCSESCREESWSVYHKIECQYLNICHSIGIAHLSLRIVLTAGWKYLLCFREQMTTSEFYQNRNRIGGVLEDGTYDKTYLSVYDLMTHSDDIEIVDSFQYSLTALLLITILKQSCWLNTGSADDTFLTNGEPKNWTELQFSQDDIYIGGLLLRHVEQLICNGHAITELQITQISDSSLVDSKSQERVATAIYPTTSLLNHSCDTSIIAGFDKDLLVVRVIKDIEAGEEIFNCYGPDHKRMSKLERQEALKTQYFFTCQCSACQKEDKQDVFNSFCCPMCREMVKIRNDIYTCTSCDFTGKLADLIKEEKACKEMFINGLECLQIQNVKGAIQKLKDCLDLQIKILYKHHKNLAETQDCLARCYAIAEQYDRAVPYLRESVDTVCQLYGDNSIEYANELHKFAGILCHANEVKECLTVIDKAVHIFTLHFGDKYEFVEELENMKISVIENKKLY